MRILLINYEYPPIGAGAASSARLLAVGLAGRGHDVTVLTSALGPASEREEDGVRVVRLNTGRTSADRADIGQMGRFLAAAALRVPRLGRRADVCLVYFSMPCGPLGLLARLTCSTPYVVSLRGGDVPGAEPELARMHALLGPVRRLVLCRAATVTANSEGLRRMSLAADPVPVAVIPNGVDTDRFSPGPTRRENDPPVCLFVGRWRSQKQLGFVLRCLAEARKSGCYVKLRLVGGGPEEADLRALARNLHLEDAVSFHPWCGREDIVDHYRGADVYINLSLYEGMPNTVLEAMACGLPVLASDVAGNDAVVRDGVTGRLVPPGDMDAAVRALCALAADKDGRLAMGRAARAAAESDFSVPAMVAAYETTLKNALRAA